MRLACCVVLLLSSGDVWAFWRAIEVPAGRCGDGSSYRVYLRQGDPTRLVLYFSGGGACWSGASCRGPVPFASMRVKGPPPEHGLFFFGPSSVSPLREDTILYFPYCTGDIHVGRHVAEYDGAFVMSPPRRVYHWGEINVRQTLATVRAEDPGFFERAKRVVIYGASSGAIGSVYHARFVDSWVRPRTRRSMILDSPGFHFGHRFWRKFPKGLLDDFERALKSVGVEFDPDDGNLARHAPAVCALFQAWQVGILQGSLDLVMSAVFAQRSPLAHEAEVYGPDGLYAKTEDPRDNCAAWVPRSAWHTYLDDSAWSSGFSAGGVTAMEFAEHVILFGAGENHR